MNFKVLTTEELEVEAKVKVPRTKTINHRAKQVVKVAVKVIVEVKVNNPDPLSPKNHPFSFHLGNYIHETNWEI